MEFFYVISITLFIIIYLFSLFSITNKNKIFRGYDDKKYLIATIVLFAILILLSFILRLKFIGISDDFEELNMANLLASGNLKDFFTYHRHGIIYPYVNAVFFKIFLGIQLQ
ncbi:MAG: hypothetical protein K6357_07655 [Elusimicrobiota bacterium]